MTTPTQEVQMTLILGGTGKSGRRVAARFAARESAATGVWHG
jgi:uncharacterized protein YbjT (DUF2867 family)